jgi:hypothetical protein
VGGKRQEVENLVVYMYRFKANLDVRDVIEIIYHEYTWI